MKDEMIQQLIDYLKEGHDFILEQAPDFIQHLLKYQKLSATWGIIFLVPIMLFLIGLAFYNIYNPVFDKYESRCMSNQLLCFAPFLICFALLAPLLHGIDTLIKINTAPKVFLIEYLMKLKG